MKIKNIDHIVIPVSDIDKSLHFYTEVLGMEADTSNQRFAVKFGNQKINLHVGKAQFLPTAKHPAFGSADICLLTEGNIEEIKVEVESKGIEIEVGIVQRQGAQGAIRSYANQPGGVFKFDRFYKQIAVAYGLGLRLDLDFFILRFDGGMKAVNPAYETRKEHFPIIHPKFSRDFAFHFAVGYPF